ncbi:MAG: A/G-specific adenine glycosylase [Candidatus Methylomirabilales bacterium]
MRRAEIAPTLKRTFQRRLLRWFRSHGRDLPWRNTRDAYRILVSEVMLQQTQVDRVLEFYDKFLERYPTAEELASARPSRVREAWDGLGYYARARNLHRAARRVIHQYGGEFPKGYDEAHSLPGVGRSTAGALLSFAFNSETPILDTNVKRLLSRVFIQRPSPTPAQMERRLWQLSASLIPKGKAWAFNQALMDFGALVCTAKNPRCRTCCFTDICRAYPKLMRERGQARGINHRRRIKELPS